MEDSLRELAANILEGYDSSKHSGVIAFFNQTYLKTEQMDRSLSQIVKSTSYLREKSDYDDFYIASKFEAEEQLRNADRFVDSVRKWIVRENILG